LFLPVNVVFKVVDRQTYILVMTGVHIRMYSSIDMNNDDDDEDDCEENQVPRLCEHFFIIQPGSTTLEEGKGQHKDLLPH